MFKSQTVSLMTSLWRKTVPGSRRRNTKRSVADCLETCLW